MATYDPTFEMEDGEHIFGAITRRNEKAKSNEMIDFIISQLENK
jgi:hypothetical protein